MSTATDYRVPVRDILEATVAMLAVFATLPADERAALEAWEREHLDGATVGTTDWPGWERFIDFSSWRSAVEARRLATPRPRPQTSAAVQLRVFRRDGFACQRCRGHDDLTVDHIVPVSRGGTDAPENLQTLCRGCNSRKGARGER